MKFPSPKGIIFDMDGVIVDSEPIHEETEKMTLREYHIEVPELEWNNFSGVTNKEMFSYIVQTFTDGNVTVDELVEHLTKTYLAVAPKKITMIKGALDFIRTARGRKLRIGLATSSKKEVQEMVFSKFNLKKYFDVIITSEDVTKGKPDPQPYLLAASRLCIPAVQCIVIEDSINGIKSANAAGCFAVGITTSFPATTLQDAGADIVVDSFKELQKKLFTTRP